MEFDLLKAFADHPHKVLSRERLLDLAHNKEMSAFDRSIDTRIGRIRQKIEVDPETYTVKADGRVLTCEPAKILPMAQRYFLF